jgi:hypothetical protein
VDTIQIHKDTVKDDSREVIAFLLGEELQRVILMERVVDAARRYCAANTKAGGPVVATDAFSQLAKAVSSHDADPVKRRTPRR